MPADFTALDSLVRSGRCFAVYRIPGRSVVMYLQVDNRPETLSDLTGLNDRSGFVMAPFQASETHPVVLIRPDRIVQGESNVIRLAVSAGKENEVSGTSGWPEGFGHTDSSNEFKRYRSAFELFQKALHAGSCDKVVLSRTQRLDLTEGFSIGTLFQSACTAYPDAFVYLCHTQVTGTWLGSTPELLLSGNKGSWQTVALAGTRKLSANQGDWDLKNIREQQIVTAYLEKQLRIKNLMGSVSEPYTVRAGQVMHLKTDFRFEWKEPGHIGDLLDFLHPTPAVSGYPKQEACRLILSHEGYDRAYYTGFAGPLDREGKTDLYVNLRCARTLEDGLLLYAGGGLMPDSDLQAEWEETEVKLQTLSSLLLV